jgi:hypothetical protein
MSFRFTVEQESVSGFVVVVYGTADWHLHADIEQHIVGTPIKHVTAAPVSDRAAARAGDVNIIESYLKVFDRSPL